MVNWFLLSNGYIPFRLLICFSGWFYIAFLFTALRFTKTLCWRNRKKKKDRKKNWTSDHFQNVLLHLRNASRWRHLKNRMQILPTLKDPVTGVTFHDLQVIQIIQRHWNRGFLVFLPPEHNKKIKVNLLPWLGLNFIGLEVGTPQILFDLNLVLRKEVLGLKNQ